MIYVLYGVSGSGKSEVGKILKDLGVRKLITHTTRNPREEEINGKDYYFVSVEEFNEAELVEFVFYCGNYYGLSKAEVAKNISKGSPCFVVLEREGAIFIKEKYKDQVCFVKVCVPPEIVEKRLEERGEDKEIIRKRLEKNKKQEEMEIGFDFLLVNDGSIEELKKKTQQILPF